MVQDQKFCPGLVGIIPRDNPHGNPLYFHKALNFNALFLFVQSPIAINFMGSRWGLLKFVPSMMVDPD